MHLLVAGVRQRQTSLQLRERFAFGEDEIPEASAYLLRQPGINECAILTTCNRTEIYCVVERTDTAMESIKRFFREFKDIDPDRLAGNFFTLLHEDAMMHLFRVASGLDSLILGEGQILAQVKDVQSQAQRLGATGRVLDKLFNAAVTAGKRVRHETGIASKDASVSQAAYDFAKKRQPDLLKQPIAIIGGGKMASILMARLQERLPEERRSQVTIINRSQARLKTLCDKFGFSGTGWENVASVIGNARVIFVATGAPHYVLYPEQFEGTGDKLVIDISVPRNVDPQVGEVAGVSLFNTDDLEGISEFTPERESRLLSQAQQILEQEYGRFYQWYVSLSVVPTITGLKSKVEAIRKAQLASMRRSPENEMLDQLSRSLVNKILHEPIVQLRNGSTREEIAVKAEVLGQLFNIEGHGGPRDIRPSR